MGYPTIKDLAAAAGVSVSTVNRVIGGSGSVREVTMRRILAAAEEIGFYGLGVIQHRMAAQRQKYHFVIMLLQSNRSFYQVLGQALEQAAAAVTDADVKVTLSFNDDLSPDVIAERLDELGSASDGIAVVTAEHPRVTEAINSLAARGVAVLSLISPLSASGNVSYIGLDNWKVGRTVAWAFHHLCKAPGKIGILVGNHRYRCQELNESGFRSYFREHGSGFVLLEPLSTFESAAIAREMTEKLLTEHPDMKGLYISGGGITGSMAALRDSGRSQELVSIGYEVIDATKAALLDGTLTMVISHPIDMLAQETIAAMIRARTSREQPVIQNILLPFSINSPENL